MKTIILNQSQIEKVCTELENVNGEFDKFIDFEDLSLNIYGTIESEGYNEDDYHNGTGSYIETSRTISLNIVAYTEDDEFSVTNESEIEEYLMTA